MMMEQATWKDVEKCISEKWVLVIPIGSVEQHGPHLPLATDLFSVLGIAKLIGEKVSILVAPPIYYTYAKPMRPFPGTISIEGTTLIALLKDIVSEFLRQGFKKILFLSGHYENLAFIREGTEIAIQLAKSDNAKVVITTWWDLVPEKTLKQIFTGDWEGWQGVHASLAETSLALALNPELVRTSQIVDDQPPERLPYDVLPCTRSSLPKSGVFSKTTSSSREKGELLKETVIRGVLALIAKEFGEP